MVIPRAGTSRPAATAPYRTAPRWIWR